MSKGKFAIGAVIGAVAGIIAGLLAAPKAGKQMRIDLKAKTSELKKQAVWRVEATKTKAHQAAELKR
jgi:gas vesicle protein